MGDVQGEKWYSRWIAACTASLENVFSWGPEHVICVGIQADTGVNPATEAEFPALQRHIQLGFKEKRIKGPADAWSLMEFRLIPLRRLDAVIKEATDNTYVVVMSCPGQHFATVTERCQGNRNVLKCWGAADDLSNNLDGLKVSVEEAVLGHGGAVASANLGGAAASARRASSIPSAPVASGKFMRFAMMSPGIPGGANVRRTTTVASEKIGCVRWDVFPSDTVEVTRVSQVGPDQWLKLAPSMLNRIDDGKKVAFDPHVEGWCVNYYDSDGWMFCPVSKYKMLSPGIPQGGARVRRTPSLRADHVGTVTWGAFRNDTIEVIEAKIVDGEEWLKLAPAMKRIIRADSDYRSFNAYTEGWCVNFYDRYAYAFDVIEDSGTRFAFYCGNQDSGVIRDSVLFRTAKLNSSGHWAYSDDERVALPHSANPVAWDAEHACDPDVVASEQPGGFTLNGTRYTFALFYTGINSDNDPHGNSVGIAVANDLSGPWVRLAAPLIWGTMWWGAGQPSGVTLHNSTVLLTFTRGDSNGTRLMSTTLDLSVVDAPVVITPEFPVTTSGLTTAQGAQDHLDQNVAIAFDPNLDQFWTVRDGHPYPSTAPNFISASVQVATLPGQAMRRPSSPGIQPSSEALEEWTVVAEAVQVNGSARTHNSGWVTDRYGRTLPGEPHSGMVTRAGEGWPAALWSYRPVAVTITDHYLLSP